jgi:hypothetical protein
VRSWADREKGFAPATSKVLGYLLGHINRDKGYDWHSAATIARELAMTTRTVERSFKELVDAGWASREHFIVGGSQASKRWRTTLPKLVAAGGEPMAQNDDEGPDRKIAKDPTGNSENGEGPDKKGNEGPDENVGQIREEEEHHDYDGSARARASTDADAIHAFQGGATFERVAAITADHAETFRDLSDRFGRRSGEMVQRPTNREDSDPVLQGLVRSELGGYPPVDAGL